MGPYILPHIPGFKTLPLTKRCLLLIVGDILCSFVMSAVDIMADCDPSGALVFSIVGVNKAVQGLCAGMLLVIVQVCSFHYKTSHNPMQKGVVFIANI